MRVIRSRTELEKYLAESGGIKRGFVPTMGALHEGHLSLVSRSINSCKLTVVSIFVNPAQFNDPKDLNSYPRTPDKDILMLSALLGEMDVAYLPGVEEVYEGEEEADIDLGGLDLVMEGKFRPGHFKGVVRVVKLLFDSVKPDMAFFGQKDFQQLTIIRAMARQTHPEIIIEGCPILREKNGLAMSSRNIRLSAKARERAAIIHNTLLANSVVNSGDSIESVSSSVIRTIEASEGFKVEYFDLVDNIKLQSLTSFDDVDPSAVYYGCIAVNIEGIRLIDNIQFSFPFSKG